MSKLENLKDIIDSNFENMDISDKAKNKIIQSTKPNENRVNRKIFKILSVPAVAVIILCAMFFLNIFINNSTVVVNAKNLMEGIEPDKVQPINLNSDFINSQADFSFDLFKSALKKDGNTLISPVSVYQALAMTANGASGDTLHEFQTLLGKYNLTMKDINNYCYSYIKNLTDSKSGKLNIANSIWITNNDGFKVNKNFLQTNADYFGASAFKADFNSNKTLNEINNWVKTNTGNLIDKIVEQIDPNVVMYLINTLYFEAEWQNKFYNTDITKKDFYISGDKTVSADFMRSTELGYLNDESAKGFIKPYKDNKFSFVALLPNEGINVDEYAKSLTGEKFLSIMKNKADEAVSVEIPKFKCEFGSGLVEPLKAIGLKTCFDRDKADFSNMAEATKGSLYVSDIQHKTYINVDQLGSKAGAVTSVEMSTKGMMVINNRVTLDRPFVYAIVDNETGLPIFLGTLHNPKV